MTKKKQLFGAELENRRIQVYWPMDKQFYTCKVIKYNERTGKHKVLYEDDDQENLLLSKEKWRLVLEDAGKETAPAQEAVERVDEGEKVSDGHMAPRTKISSGEEKPLVTPEKENGRGVHKAPNQPASEPEVVAESFGRAKQAEPNTGQGAAQSGQGAVPPAQGAVQPVQGVAQPAQGVVQPAQGVVQPAQGVVQPAQGVVQPAQGVVQPVQAVAQPVQAVAQPVQGVVQPVQGVVQPVQGVVQPVQGVVQPVQGVVQPVQGVVQPVQGIVQPVQGIVQTVQGVVQHGQGIVQSPAPQVLRGSSTIPAVPQAEEKVKNGTGESSVGLGQKRALDEDGAGTIEQHQLRASAEPSSALMHNELVSNILMLQQEVRMFREQQFILQQENSIHRAEILQMRTEMSWFLRNYGPGPLVNGAMQAGTWAVHHPGMQTEGQAGQLASPQAATQSPVQGVAQDIAQPAQPSMQQQSQTQAGLGPGMQSLGPQGTAGQTPAHFLPQMSQQVASQVGQQISPQMALQLQQQVATQVASQPPPQDALQVTTQSTTPEAAQSAALPPPQKASRGAQKTKPGRIASQVAAQSATQAALETATQMATQVASQAGPRSYPQKPAPAAEANATNTVKGSAVAQKGTAKKATLQGNGVSESMSTSVQDGFVSRADRPVGRASKRGKAGGTAKSTASASGAQLDDEAPDAAANSRKGKRRGRPFGGKSRGADGKTATDDAPPSENDEVTAMNAPDVPNASQTADVRNSNAENRDEAAVEAEKPSQAATTKADKSPKPTATTTAAEAAGKNGETANKQIVAAAKEADAGASEEIPSMISTYHSNVYTFVQQPSIGKDNVVDVARCMVAISSSIWVVENAADPEASENLRGWALDVGQLCMQKIEESLKALHGMVDALAAFHERMRRGINQFDWLLYPSRDPDFQLARANYGVWKPPMTEKEWQREKVLLKSLQLRFWKGCVAHQADMFSFYGEMDWQVTPLRVAADIAHLSGKVGFAPEDLRKLHVQADRAAQFATQNSVAQPTKGKTISTGAS